MAGTHFRSIIIFVFIFSVISFVDVWGQHLKRCAGIDQYCQTHTDCCSNSCLSFLYRCTRNYNDVYPYTFFGEKYPPTGTLDDVLEFTFSNAGSVREMQNNRLEQNSQSFSSPNPYNRQVENTHNYGNLNLRYRRDTVDGVVEQQQTESDNIAAEDKQTSESVAADCKPNGQKCYTNDECCSKRCHGFLHQCVT